LAGERGVCLVPSWREAISNVWFEEFEFESVAPILFESKSDAATTSLWSAGSINAVASDIVFSQDLHSLEKGTESTFFEADNFSHRPSCHPKR
jgi:hypothetical protein